MPTADLAKTINMPRNTDQVMLCDATFVNRETCMTITDGQLRITPTRTEIRAGHRWLPLWTKRHGIEPKITRARLHLPTHLGATR